MKNETPDNYIQRNDYTSEPGPPEESIYDSNFPCDPETVVDNATNATRDDLRKKAQSVLDWLAGDVMMRGGYSKHAEQLFTKLQQEIDASHLNKPASTLAEIDQQIKEYWKSKEGRCLACNAEIAIQDSYCPACNDFLLEVHTKTETQQRDR